MPEYSLVLQENGLSMQTAFPKAETWYTDHISTSRVAPGRPTETVVE